jgi:hypothetical protein
MMPTVLALLAAAAAPAAQAATCTAKIENHTHYPKVGYKDINDIDLAACCAACEQDPNCGGFTLQEKEKSHSTCHLKSHDMGAGSASATAISGVIPGRGPPPPPPIKPAPAGAKNVLFIISDDMRPSIGAYGLKEAVTPHLDQLAKEGVLFTRAHIQFSYCAPSRNSFMYVYNSTWSASDRHLPTSDRRQITL